MPPIQFSLQTPSLYKRIKEAWKQKWETFKYECIKSGEWMDLSNGIGSGTLKNPGKRVFLKLAADSVREVDALRDKNGV